LITAGDIVIKVMHITSSIWGNTKFEDVIRLIFHTGFIDNSQKMLVFKKIDLDLAYKDNRYLSETIVFCSHNKLNECFFQSYLLLKIFNYRIPDDFELRLYFTVESDTNNNNNNNNNKVKSVQESSPLQKNTNLSKNIKKELNDETWQEELFQQFVCTV
jgi:hypothetical protein